MKFRGGSQPTVGLEMEFQLLDGKTLDLTNAILPLMRQCADEPCLKPEMNQATVEVNTMICSNSGELEQSFAGCVSCLCRQCRDMGLVLCGGGTHPFCKHLPRITPLPRYRDQAKTAGYLSHIMVTFGMHVHVGMACGDEAVRVMGRLKPYLPLLLALSASSPFWRGRDSGYASYRQRILASMRSYGIPPAFTNWRDYTRFFSVARRAGVFETARDVHWDLRFQPGLGTLEIRVMDAQPSVREAISLAAFAYILATCLKRTDEDRRRLAPLHWWMQKENFFRASRSGMETQLIVDDQGKCRPMRQVLEEALEMMTPTAAELGEKQRLLALEQSLATGPSYVRQRQTYAKTKTPREVVNLLVRELENVGCP